MLINKEVISKLDPCKDRFNNYLKYYALKSHTKAQFMGLKNISQADKLWVCFRLMPKENIALAAADIAESVLHIFEDKYPNDDRPRKAIEAARKNDTKAANAAAYASNAAADAAFSANDTTYAAAYTAKAAAAAAAYASNAATAAYTIPNATYAAHYATYAANAAAATAAAKDKQVQEKLIRKICLKYWKASKQ